MVLFILYKRKLNSKCMYIMYCLSLGLLITGFASLQQQEVPISPNEAYQFNNLMITAINPNPAYEEIRRSN